MASTTSSLLFLAISCAVLSLATSTDVPQGLIQRAIKQQVLATVPPGGHESAAPFLTSPSRKYTAYLVRRWSVPSAGYGNDFCFIQIQDTADGGKDVWESECEPVSSSNACSLVFDDNGLELFDGSNSVWSGNGNGDNNYPATMELVDQGDMRVMDKDGELVWRASDDPRLNQRCGQPGSPGMAPESPPFSGPIGGNDNLPFGQQSSQGTPQVTNTGGFGQQQQQPGVGGEHGQTIQAPAPQITVGDGASGQQQQDPAGNEPEHQAPVEAPSQQSGVGVYAPQHQGLNGANQVAGVHGAQPLVDNTPYDSGCSRNGGLAALAVAFAGLITFSGFGL